MIVRSLRNSFHLFLVVVWTFLMIGCGKSDRSSSGARITLKLVHWYGNQRDNWQHEIVEPFERDHPDVRVEMEVVPYQLYYAKILASTASGATMGDVVAIDDWFAPELFNRQYTLSLQPYVDRDLKLEDFITPVFEICRLPSGDRGDLLAFPFATGTTMLFYNKDLFQDADIPFPDSTWMYADLLAAARRLTRDTDGDGRIDQWGFLTDDGSFTGFDTMLYSLGGRILSSDLRESELDRPASISAFQLIVDLVRKENGESKRSFQKCRMQ
jgi:multiple sugar transport system substrate-binding protein